jgi:hypothetical protein
VTGDLRPGEFGRQQPEDLKLAVAQTLVARGAAPAEIVDQADQYALRRILQRMALAPTRRVVPFRSFLRIMGEVVTKLAAILVQVGVPDSWP